MGTVSHAAMRSSLQKLGEANEQPPRDLLVNPKALPGTDFPPLLLSAVSCGAESPGMGQRGGDGP